MSCNREHAAFIQQLFERHRAALLRHVGGLIRHFGDAEDIVQETWSRLLETKQLERDDARARAYMFRVATNLAWDRHRRRRETSIEDLGGMEPVALLPGPDTIVDIDRALLAITQTLLQLTPRRRRVFLLRTSEGLEFEAIAERLGIGKRTAEREMKHALDACQRKLRRTLE